MIVAFLLGLGRTGQAYQIYLGTLGWQRGMLSDPASWQGLAAKAEGLNVNWANSVGRDARPAIVALLAGAKDHAYVLRGAGAIPITADTDFSGTFEIAQAYGYTVESIYTYNGGAGQTYKEEEHNIMRTWLDNHGHADVKIAFNGRSGTGVLERPVIEAQGIECDLTSFNENKGDRKGLLQFMADPTNKATQGEQFGLHCHMNYGKGSIEEDLVDTYGGARRTVRNVARDVLSTPALLGEFRSSRMTFAFFGIDWTTPTMPLLPETRDGSTYAESYTGTLLSLIEQRALFSGLAGPFPDDTQCGSFLREGAVPAKTYSAVADGSVNATATWTPIPVPVVGDLNIWNTGARALSVAGAANNSTTTFNGGRLVIEAGGKLDANVEGAALQVNNLVLDGGLITQSQGRAFNVNLTGDTLTLNSGTIQAGQGTRNRNVIFDNGLLAGAGSIDITAMGASGFYVEFASTINSGGFRGTFNVKSNGILKLPASTKATFGIKLSGSGKLFGDTNIELSGLEIDGVSFPVGTYPYASFSPAQQAHFVNTTGVVTVRGDVTAIADGMLNDPATWGVTPPSAGDIYKWKTGAHAVTADAATTTFNGGSLVIETGGTLDPQIAGATVAVNHLILDGGTITTTKLQPITIDLTGHILTLNSGTLRAGQGTNNRNITFTNGSLEGSGTINIAALGAGGFYIRFDDTMEVSGFDGTFDVNLNGVLKLPVVPEATFGLRLSGTGKLDASGTVPVTSLTIDGTSFYEGVYPYASLTPAQRVFFVNPNVTISVVDIAYQNWAAEYGDLVGGRTADDDADGQSNVLEIATGGDPTKAGSQGLPPTLKEVQESGADWIEFTHLERIDAARSLTRYTVEVCDDLKNPVWTTAGVVRSRTDSYDSSFNLATERVDVSGKTRAFVRLRVE